MSLEDEIDKAVHEMQFSEEPYHHHTIGDCRYHVAFSIMGDVKRISATDSQGYPAENEEIEYVKSRIREPFEWEDD